MIVEAITPILNVSNLAESVAWFERLGWTKGFQWGEPPTFGAVRSGDFEIFLCQGAGGARQERPLDDQRLRPAGRQGRLDVDLGGRRRRRPPALP